MIPGSIRICVPNFAARLQSYGRVEKKGEGTDRHTHKGTLELERLLCTVILPSCMYGVALYVSQMKERDFEYLYVVQGRHDKGLVLGVKVLFHYCAAGGDTMETSCVLPTTTWGSYGLVRGRGGHTIDIVW